jgi:hypothetical protein
MTAREVVSCVRQRVVRIASSTHNVRIRTNYRSVGPSIAEAPALLAPGTGSAASAGAEYRFAREAKAGPAA